MADIVASGDWWEYSSDGLLKIYCDGDMPNYNQYSNNPPWDSYIRNIVEVQFYHYWSGDANVTSIGSYAFYSCSNLQTITIPDSVTSIGESAFYSCGKISSITLPSGISSVNKRTFMNCRSLESVVFLGDVSSIGSSAFSGCTALSDIDLQNGLTSIADSAFAGCGLTSIYIPDSVTAIGAGAFQSNAKLTSAVLSTEIKAIPNFLFYDCRSLTGIDIPDGVETIGEHSFEQVTNNSFESISLPKSLSSIGASAFYYCYKLSMVEYPGTREEWNLIDIQSGNNYLTRIVEANFDKKEQEEREKEERERQEAMLAKQYHSITIGAYNTWRNWRLIPTSRPVVNPPEVKTNFVDIPGADGVLDFTEALDEKIHYKPSEGSWEFLICHEQIDIDTDNKYHSENRWSILWHDILNAIHGKRNQVILMDEWREGAEDNRFYIGRVWLNQFVSDPHHSKIVFDYNLEPFRYLTTEDAQNRVNGVL